MPELSKDLIALLSYLLPGFLVAWLFYALTSHQKPAQLERVIQALIFTLVVNGLVVLEKTALLWLGHSFSLGEWTKDSELIASIATAIAFGLLTVYCTNTDVLHKWLRDRNLSKQSSHPTEWCTTFALHKSYVVLEMKDGRRLYGWPQIWPSNFEKGHLYITEAAWMHGAEPVEMPIDSGVLVPVTDVQHVEFINTTPNP
jgi:Family of unknown function (DUF6338)